MGSEHLFGVNTRTTVGPLEEPTTFADVKESMRISGASLDTAVAQEILDARREIENITKFLPVDQTVVQSLRGFPIVDKPIPLFRTPVSSVTSIVYEDTDGVSQTLASTEWEIYEQGDVSYVTLKKDKSWPSDSYYDPIRTTVDITFQVGESLSTGQITQYPWVREVIILKCKMAIDDLSEKQFNRLERVHAYLLQDNKFTKVPQGDVA